MQHRSYTYLLIWDHLSHRKLRSCCAASLFLPPPQPTPKWKKFILGHAPARFNYVFLDRYPVVCPRLLLLPLGRELFYYCCDFARQLVLQWGLFFICLWWKIIVSLRLQDVFELDCFYFRRKLKFFWTDRMTGNFSILFYFVKIIIRYFCKIKFNYITYKCMKYITTTKLELNHAR